MEFRELGISSKILEGITLLGWKEPTPIQAESIPLLMQGEDLIGQAQTGTGKTGAFGICILERILAAGHIGKPIGLVLAPTRELAMQVCKEIEGMGSRMDVSIAAVYGGQDIERQIRQLRDGADIVVGTPGRILDHLDRGTLDLSGVQVAVLDEADRMLDMGFVEDVEHILKNTQQKRQTMLFSATMPEPIKQLSMRYMVHPQHIRVGEDTLAVEKIKQFFIEVTRFNRLPVLMTLLMKKKPGLALVFCRTKMGADRLEEILGDRGFEAMCLHGDLSQNKRDRVMAAFRSGKLHMLVATDLAARGLDVQGITHVINYDMPGDSYTYIHRIGRTGRVGADGEAITFVFTDQLNELYSMEKLAGTKIEKLEMPEEPMPPRVRFGRREEGGRGGRGGSGGHGRFGGSRSGAGSGSHGGGYGHRSGDSSGSRSHGSGPHSGGERGGYGSRPAGGARRSGGRFGDRRGGHDGERREPKERRTRTGSSYFGRRG
jgi:ATP-dependent RNA helicase DeaD